MGKKFSQMLTERLDNEYRRGFTAALGIVLLGYYNKVDPYIPDEQKQIEFFHHWEDEVNRIITEECKENIIDVAELIAGHVAEIRERWGLNEDRPDRC